MARKLYIRPAIGLGTFKKIYGASKRRGARPPHASTSSGSIARFILKELERLKVVEKTKTGYAFTVICLVLFLCL